MSLSIESAIFQIFRALFFGKSFSPPSTVGVYSFAVILSILAMICATLVKIGEVSSFGSFPNLVTIFQILLSVILALCFWVFVRHSGRNFITDLNGIGGQ